MFGTILALQSDSVPTSALFLTSIVGIITALVGAFGVYMTGKFQARNNDRQLANATALKQQELDNTRQMQQQELGSAERIKKIELLNERSKALRDKEFTVYLEALKRARRLVRLTKPA